MKLHVTDAEINHLLPDILPTDLPVEDTSILVQPGGLVLKGSYPAMGFRMSFEMVWRLTVLPGQVEAHLQDVRVAGLGAGKLRGVLLKLIRDAIGTTPGIKVEEERAVLNVTEYLHAEKWKANLEVLALNCREGELEMELKVGS